MLGVVYGFVYIVFPAPAGVIPNLKKLFCDFSCFPRTCGGDPISIGEYVVDSEFSPHLRG